MERFWRGSHIVPLKSNELKIHTVMLVSLWNLPDMYCFSFPISIFFSFCSVSRDNWWKYICWSQVEHDVFLEAIEGACLIDSLFACSCVLNPPLQDSPHSPSAMANQQYCLKWNNHQSNLLRAFDRLLQSESFTDVTLACEGKSLRAHKVSKWHRQRKSVCWTVGGGGGSAHTRTYVHTTQTQKQWERYWHSEHTHAQ